LETTLLLLTSPALLIAFRFLLATRNPGKVEEIRALLADLDVEIVPAGALDEPLDVVEDADTLSGNAEKKARAYYDRHALPALADDTGLEVDALGGKPGVHTARFAGPDATAADNTAKMLQELDGVDDRSARFRTVACLIDADGTAHHFHGVCEGRIARQPRGEQGFGYDPIFVPDGYDQTFAEMDANAKNAISHRKKAIHAVRKHLAQTL
jgi:XTP/dITP diphosphohydrolase